MFITVTIVCYDINMNTDKHGFPIEECGRCGSSGRYPSSAWNGVCLGCGGGGWVHPAGTVAKLAAQWQTIRRQATGVALTVCRAYAEDGSFTVVADVLAGDQVRLDSDSPWRTVAEVTPGTEVRGSAHVGVGDNRRLLSETLATTVRFEDGETDYVETPVVWQRRLTPEVTAELAALVGKATKAHATLAKGRATRAAKAEEKRAHLQAEREANVQQLVETHPDLAVLIGDQYADATGFVADMRAAVLAGKPSDKQVAAAVAAVRRDRERAQAKRDARDAGVTVPTGRLDIEGTVVATWTKWSDRGWGSWVHKMRVSSPDGWTAAGTIPAALLENAPPTYRTSDEPDPVDASRWLRGQRVKIRATFEPSSNDPLSGWFSRPTVEVLTAAVSA